jgi:hypothetical protein
MVMNQGMMETLERRTMMAVSLSGAAYVPVTAKETVISDRLDRADRSDVYYTAILRPGTLHLRLDALHKPATMELIHDRNHNGRFDSGELIARVKGNTISPASVSSLLDPGTYFVRINQGTSPDLNRYKVRFSNQPLRSVAEVDVTGNTPATARLLDMPARGNRSYYEYIGPKDTTDIYRWNITQKSRIDVRLSGLQYNADLELIHDRNRNGRVDPGEVVKTTAGSAPSNKVIRGVVAPGTYFLRVTPKTPLATTYALRTVASQPRTMDPVLTS